ncbi:MAG: NAD(P)H-binding protein [Patulibacter sp.]
MLTLVTGASGFAGSLLIDPLRRRGHDVRAFARDPSRVTHDVPVFVGDVSTGAGLREALDGVAVAYYLVHSMEPAPAGHSFEDRERESAERFADAAHAAGVRRIVYLGVMIDETRPLSAHLRSRLTVEQLLCSATPEAVALRASIAIGARSRSFRFLVRLVERMPVLALPPWHRFRTQTIDQRDLVAALLSAGTTPAADAASLSLDVAGPDVLSYGQIIEGIRDLMMLPRPTLAVPLDSTPIFGRIAAAITGEDEALILPLMGGLTGDLLARDASWSTILDVRPHTFSHSVNRALFEMERVERLRAR